MGTRNKIQQLIDMGYTEQWIAYNAGLATSTINRIKRGKSKEARPRSDEKINSIFTSGKVGWPNKEA